MKKGLFPPLPLKQQISLALINNNPLARSSLQQNANLLRNLLLSCGALEVFMKDLITSGYFFKPESYRSSLALLVHPAGVHTSPTAPKC